MAGCHGKMYGGENMVVKHNLTAMNSNRMLSAVQHTRTKSTEKISSGYKINRASDDAAGLSISEKMRKQIRGLTQASYNAQDGISMVQIADGAMSEVQDMIQRMNELAIKAANGTNSDDDRAYMQAEIDQLISEINRVGTTTKFNEMYVLQGKIGTASNTIQTVGRVPVLLSSIKGSAFAGTQKLTQIEKSASGYYGLAMSIDLSGINADNIEDFYGVGVSATCLGCKAYKTLKFVNGYSADGAGGTPYAPSGNSVPNNTFIYEINISEEALRPYLSGNNYGTAIGKAMYAQFSKTAGTDTLFSGTHGVEVDLAGDKATGTINYAKILMFDKRGGYQYSGSSYVANGSYSSYTNGEAAGSTTIKSSNGGVMDGYEDNVVVKEASHEMTYLHVGADSSEDNRLEIKLGNISSFALGFQTYTYDVTHRMDLFRDAVNVKTAARATQTIEVISTALKYVAQERSRMGAYQNRLEHTISNLSNVVENTTSAESHIRDTDMAKEMVKYSNNTILYYAGHAILAQANQTNEDVLGLLR